MPERGRKTTLLMTDVKVERHRYRVRVKNISAGGLRLSGIGFDPGTRVEVCLPRLGWVVGNVAWQNGDTCGIKFDARIDPAAIHARVTGSYRAPPPEPEVRHVA